jgi:hypothetical protein
MTLKVWTALVTAAVCVFLGCWSLLHHGSLGRGQIKDTVVYVKYGHKVVQGKVPYRDFSLEYPPAALPVIILPALIADRRPAYDRWFDREMALCGCLALIGSALCLLRLGAGARRTAAALGLIAVSPLLLGSVVLTRFDSWPTALTVFALAALLWERRTTAALLLGAAIGAKLWPAALLPLSCIWLVRRHGVRAAAAFAGVTVLVIATIFLPFTVLSPHGIGHSFYRQFARPLQIESLGASVLVAVHYFAHIRIGTPFGFGSRNLGGTAVHETELATSVLGGVSIVAVWALFARGPATPARLATFVAAAVATLLAFGKVFSPQFMIWLVPFVVLVAGRRGIAAGALAAVALGLTHLWFPHHYEVLASFYAKPSFEVLLRNLTVVALAAVLVWPRSEERSSARAAPASRRE